MSYIQGNPWLAGGEEASGIGNALSTVLLRVPQIRAQIMMMQQDAALKQQEFALRQQESGPTMALQGAQTGLANSQTAQNVFGLKEAQSRAQFGTQAGNAIQRLLVNGNLQTAPTLAAEQGNQRVADLGLLGQAAGETSKGPDDMITSLQRLMAQRQIGNQIPQQDLVAMASGSHIQPQQQYHNVAPGGAMVDTQTLKPVYQQPSRPYAVHDPTTAFLNFGHGLLSSAAAIGGKDIMNSPIYQQYTNMAPGVLGKVASELGITNAPPPPVDTNSLSLGATIKQGTGTNVVKIIKTQDDFNALPKGAKFIFNGRSGTKQ